NIGGAVASTYDDGAAPAGTVTPGVASAGDGTVLAHVVLSLAGEGINDGDTNDYRCSLTAPDAAGQTSGDDTGFRRPTGLTYKWYRSQTDVDAGPWDVVAGGTTDPFNDANYPANGDGRYAYCEVNATGADAQDSTSDRGFRAVIPTVTTLHCSGFAEYSAVVNGVIISSIPVSTTIGFDYGLTDAYGDSWTTTGTWDDAELFWGELTALTPATVYHFRAKASNGFWGYGEDMVFSTQGSPVLYEYLNDNDDDVGDDIYAGEWADQQFTVGATAHSLT
ncbi:unnamed protein product, partial [marine sediment metagenome]